MISLDSSHDYIARLVRKLLFEEINLPEVVLGILGGDIFRIRGYSNENLTFTAPDLHRIHVSSNMQTK